tara:strand:+ start:888 stop:1346 length:459 start_codon:yes stop_codon:yes gene_type:complete
VKKFFFVLILIFFDFLSKVIIYNTIELHKFVYILPFLDFAHIHNYGISFGLFAGILDHKIIIIIGSIVTLFFIYILLKSRDIFEKWALLLIISGAISNILDRTLNNYVLDFIYLHYKDFYWPAFNFADIYITFGIIMILIKLVKEMIYKTKL